MICLNGAAERHATPRFDLLSDSPWDVRDRLPLRRFVLSGLALAVITTIRVALDIPFEPLKLVLIPVVVPQVVLAAYLLLLAVRSFELTNPRGAIVELLTFGGALLASFGEYLLFFLVPRADTVLPAPAATLFMIGLLMLFTGLVPFFMTLVSRDRTLFGSRGAVRPIFGLIVVLLMIAVVLRVVVFGPLAPE